MSNHGHEIPTRYQEAKQLTQELVGTLEERIVASGTQKGIVRDPGNEDFAPSEVAIYRLGLKSGTDERYVFEQHVNINAGQATYTALDVSERPGKILSDKAVYAPSEGLFTIQVPGSIGVLQTNLDDIKLLHEFIKTADVMDEPEIEQSLKPVEYTVDQSLNISKENNKRDKKRRVLHVLGRVAGSVISGTSKDK